MHCDLLIPPPPPEGGSGKPIGNKTLLKTWLDFLPISKYLVSKILWWAIIFVMKSHLELPEKVSNVPTAFIGVLSYSRGFWFLAVWSPWYTPFLGGGILIGALVLAILKRAEICWWELLHGLVNYHDSILTTTMRWKLPHRTNGAWIVYEQMLRFFVLCRNVYWGFFLSFSSSNDIKFHLILQIWAKILRTGTVIWGKLVRCSVGKHTSKEMK